ncbi:hypothetical protein CRENBAI_017947 [Crenichthys baileyi]|uniref:Uncharacterized protein n=1 Tax=Crenichthys baileyi TaxID=28760 RepID=A0AAV9R7S0_9TELE
MELADSRQENARELAPAGPGSGRGAVDLFTFLPREAEKTLRRSAGLSVPQSAYDGSRINRVKDIEDHYHGISSDREQAEESVTSITQRIQQINGFLQNQHTEMGFVLQRETENLKSLCQRSDLKMGWKSFQQRIDEMGESQQQKLKNIRSDLTQLEEEIRELENRIQQIETTQQPKRHEIR